MGEPFSSTGVAYAVVGGVTLAGLFSRIDPGVLTASLAGALIFMVSSKEYSLTARAFLTGASVVAGVTGGEFIASLITAAAPEGVTAKEPLGAFVTAAIAVGFLMVIGDKLPSIVSAILGRLWPGGNDGNPK